MKSLVLIRHAHRYTTLGRDLDNGLSIKGKKQRKRIARYFFKYHKEKTFLLFSSPSKRCVQTLASISRKSQKTIELDPQLGEQLPDESFQDFKKRIAVFLDTLQKKEEEMFLVCSHGDWIPVATSMLCGLEIQLNKGGWIEFEWEAGQVRLRNVLQKL